MKVDFSNYEKKDKVWHIAKGWIEIDSIDNSKYPINTRCGSYTVDGKVYKNDLYPIIYPNEFKIPDEAYKKPLPDLKVDSKVLVWNKDDKFKYKRHFKEFTKCGKIVCFYNGATSWSNSGTTTWDYYKIMDDKE